MPVTRAPSEGSDRPAPLHNLISWAFSRLQLQVGLIYLGKRGNVGNIFKERLTSQTEYSYATLEQFYDRSKLTF